MRRCHVYFSKWPDEIKWIIVPPTNILTGHWQGIVAPCFMIKDSIHVLDENKSHCIQLKNKSTYLRLSLTAGGLTRSVLMVRGLRVICEGRLGEPLLALACNASSLTSPSPSWPAVPSAGSERRRFLFCGEVLEGLLNDGTGEAIVKMKSYTNLMTNSLVKLLRYR